MEPSEDLMRQKSETSEREVILVQRPKKNDSQGSIFLGNKPMGCYVRGNWNKQGGQWETIYV
jgi:hypothetical protein